MASRLMRASLDNSEAEVICEFSDAIPRNEETLVTANGKLFFIGYDPDVEVDEYGASSVKNGGGLEYLCSIDLTSGDYSNYGLICYVEDEYPAADKSSSAYISGVDNGKIYITYSFTKELSDPVNDPPEWTFYNFEFDLETGQYTESALPAVLCAAEGVCAWYDGKLHVMKNGDEHIIDCAYFISHATILNDKLFVNGGWVELPDMTMHYFDEKHEGYSVIAYYDGCYILTYGNYSFEKLTEEELLSLEMEEAK